MSRHSPGGWPGGAIMSPAFVTEWAPEPEAEPERLVDRPPVAPRPNDAPNRSIAVGSASKAHPDDRDTTAPGPGLTPTTQRPAGHLTLTMVTR